MITIGSRVTVLWGKGCLLLGTVKHIHRPGGHKARYNVQLDKPITDESHEPITLVDCGQSEIREES